MALHARSAAPVAVLAAMLASPLAAAQPRPADATPTRAHAARSRARPQPPSGGAARTARADGRSEGTPPGWDPDAVVRWEDQDGTVHYTRGYEVPPRLRPKVRPVHATVGTVPLDPVETRKSAASAEVPAPPAKLPVAPLPPGTPAAPSTAGAPQGEPSGASQGPTTEPR